MKGQKISYSAAELRWIEQNCALTRRELHARFCLKFRRSDVSLDNLKSLCTRRGWKTGRDGRFAKGQVSWNFGKKMQPHPNSTATQFKKGNRTGRANHLYKPIGSERVANGGYLERKIHDGLPLQSRWRAVHLIRWEEQNGPVPAGHCLKCMDGNKQNTDPDNWLCIPRAMLPRLNGRFGRDFDAAPPELKKTILATVQLEHAARERLRKKSG